MRICHNSCFAIFATILVLLFMLRAARAALLHVLATETVFMKPMPGNSSARDLGQHFN